MLAIVVFCLASSNYEPLGIYLKWISVVKMMVYTGDL